MSITDNFLRLFPLSDHPSKVLTWNTDGITSEGHRVSNGSKLILNTERSRSYILKIKTVEDILKCVLEVKLIIMILAVMIAILSNCRWTWIFSFWDFNRIWTHVLCISTVVLHQLSYKNSYKVRWKQAVEFILTSKWNEGMKMVWTAEMKIQIKIWLLQW